MSANAVKHLKMGFSKLNGYTYVLCSRGHRQSYNDTFAEVTGLTSLIEAPVLSTVRKLMGARHLLFSTVDENRVFFSLIALSRALIGRRTSGIVMNVDTSFSGSTIPRMMKTNFHRLFTRIERVNLISILPYYLDQRYTNFSNCWIYDPQFWDLDELTQTNSIPNSELADQSIELANGRPILLFLGGPTREKGIEFLFNTLSNNLELTKSLQIVVAGKANNDCKNIIEGIRDLGAMVIDRYLTDEEVLSLNAASSSIWACYHPSYNSSSGVFGRAMQLSKRVCIRNESIIAKIANHLNYPVYGCTFGDTEEAGKMLQKIADDCKNEKTSPPTDIANTCRNLSVERLLATFDQDC